MSAEALRRAAAGMRQDNQGPVILSVADLLENEASLIEGTESHPDLHMPLNGARVDLLTAVANAYLGDTDPDG